MALTFEKQTIRARFISPDGVPATHRIEVRTSPLTGRTSRITFSRSREAERGGNGLPAPPPDAAQTETCPFCRPRLERLTPRLLPEQTPAGRLVRGASVLFPNLFPYGAYSAVSLFGNEHFVEIGKAPARSYADSLLNCRDYLLQVLASDRLAVYTAITQNHLPSAGGSLVHPHLQVHADPLPGNALRRMLEKTTTHFTRTGRHLLADLLAHEKSAGVRYVGATGPWEWIAAYAPEGFYELWAILPGICSVREPDDAAWAALARGVINAQAFYRSLGRNGYNLGLLAAETPDSRLELRLSILARANYAPWVRNDHTGYEVMLGDMATFTAPEDTARMAGRFWQEESPTPS
jgi:galactose-1-phosphate uridylyltransferase